MNTDDKPLLYPDKAALYTLFSDAGRHPSAPALLVPEFLDFGMGFFHSMPCPVYHGGHNTGTPKLNDSETYGPQEVALFSQGVFHPSYKAQAEGWRLVRVQTKFQRWLLQTFFGVS